MRRSASAPLEITIVGIDDIEDRVLNILVAQVDRIRSFHVDTIRSANQLKRFEYVSAPRLTILRLVGYEESDEIPVLFGGHFPVLRHLHMDEIARFGGNSFCNLTSLHLADFVYDSEDDLTLRGPIQDVLSVLQSSPRVICSMTALSYSASRCMGERRHLTS